VRVAPDDEVYRVRTVWLGPDGLTLPWSARYQAYGLWLALFVFILIFELVTPLSVGLPPVWEICIATLVTYAVMAYTDYDVPLRSVVPVTVGEIRRGVTTRKQTGGTALDLTARVKVTRPAAPVVAKTRPARPASLPARPARVRKARVRTVRRAGAPNPAAVLAIALLAASALTVVQGVVPRG